MSWELRVAVVTTMLLTVGALAVWLRARAARHGDPIDVASLQAPSTAVVFTRDNCPNCARVLELMQERSIPVRQVRLEEEPAVFERLGVASVPLTVITDGAGRSRSQFGGVPTGRWLRRAARRVREIPGPSDDRL